jgi:DNA-binding MarR family transcriptional regulator
MKMRQKLLESLFIELEHLDPDFRKKVAKPMMAMGAYHLTSLQRMTVIFLFRSGPQPMNAIASFHGISKQQMTPIVEVLEKHGMVKRNVNPDNRREIIVSVTDKGIKLFKDIKEQALKAWMGKLDSFSDQEIEELIFHLHAINGFMKKLEEEK